MVEHKMKILDGVRYRPEDAPQDTSTAPPSQAPAEPEQPPSRARRTRSGTRSRGDAGDHGSE